MNVFEKGNLQHLLMVIKIPCPGNFLVNGDNYSITMLNQYVRTWRLVAFLNQIYIIKLVQSL